MLASTSRRIVVNSAVLVKPIWDQQCRGMATLQEISTRLKSIRNIQKITQSMKMVSAAKYARAERELRKSKPFGEGSQKFYESVEAVPPESPKSQLLVAITSDKGLCGGVHSSVSRKIRAILQGKAENVMIACIGDKSKATLQRYAPNNILFSAKEIGRLPPVFQDASKVATEIVNADVKYETGTIVYNRSINVASYQTTELPIYTQQDVDAAAKITLYDSVDTDVIQSYMEYSLASLIYYAMKENACSEQSARMTAMESSSKNAGEMISKLQLQFNRTRQAVITRELIEIISGASALE